MTIDKDILKKEINSNHIINLTQGYKDGKFLPVYGRDALIEKTCRSLVKYSHNNVILCAPPGIGKVSIIYGVAHAIEKGTGISELDDKKIYYFDCDVLADSFSKNPNEAADKLDACVRAFAETEDIILGIKNIQALLWGTYTYTGLQVKFFTDIFLNRVISKKIRFIGTITPNELQKLQADGYLERQWGQNITIIDVPEMSPEECIYALQTTKIRREREYGIKIDDTAIKAAVYLSSRFLKDASYPEKAISLLDEAIAKLRMSAPKENKPSGIVSSIFKKDKELILTEEHITTVISEKTTVPQVKLAEEDLKLLRGLEDRMASRIIGQKEAIKAITQTVRAVRAGFGDNKRPDGVFYFVGPSGVGKTEFALALAEALYGDQSQLIRIDMSEFTHPADVSRLIGSPPGYVGYDEGGRLTEWVKKNPNSVILLDEFEKAHSGCWDIFLQMFDAGRLTDGKGVTVDFSNAIIIMTSNIGSHLFDTDGQEREPAGFIKLRQGEVLPEEKLEVISWQIREQMKRIFRPEFLNRIDEIIVFKPLEIPHLVKIADIMLQKTPVKLIYDEKILVYLAQEGYEPQYGARHLKRAIQNIIVEPAANLIVDGKLNREKPITITLNDGKLEFRQS
jgi:ATP-dependent Clp protease ATP-binding subunit ClpC